MKNLKTFGGQIRAAREAKEWNQSELGHRADLTQAQISAIENGTYPATVGLLRRVARPFKAQVVIDYNNDEPRLLLPAPADAQEGSGA